MSSLELGTCGGQDCILKCTCGTGWSDTGSGAYIKRTSKNAYAFTGGASSRAASSTPQHKTCYKSVSCSDYFSGYTSGANVSSGHYGYTATQTTNGDTLYCHKDVGTCTYSCPSGYVSSPSSGYYLTTTSKSKALDQSDKTNSCSATSGTCYKQASCNCSKVNDGASSCKAKPGNNYYANGTTSGTQSKKWSCASTSCSSHGTSAGSETVSCTNWTVCPTSKSCSNGCKTEEDSPCGGKICTECKPNCTYSTAPYQAKGPGCTTSCGNNETSTKTGKTGTVTQYYKADQDGCPDKEVSFPVDCVTCTKNCNYRDVDYFDCPCSTGWWGTTCYSSGYIPTRSDGTPECGGAKGCWATGTRTPVKVSSVAGCETIKGTPEPHNCYTCDDRVCGFFPNPNEKKCSHGGYYGGYSCSYWSGKDCMEDYGKMGTSAKCNPYLSGSKCLDGSDAKNKCHQGGTEGQRCYGNCYGDCDVDSWRSCCEQCNGRL